VGFGEAEGTYVNGKDGSVLVFVPAGTFRMGSGANARCRPEHPVLISRGYFLGKYEVSRAQFLRFCEATGARRPPAVLDYHGERFDLGPRDPVIDVSWREAMAYCEWAGLRLPTSAEWEYAARGPESRRYPWGAKFLRGFANLGRYRDGTKSADDNRDDTDGYGLLAPVDAYPEGASWCGALNMCGNVQEWTRTVQVTYSRAPRVDPDPTHGSRYVFRGLAWGNHPDDAYAAFRKWGTPGYRGPTVGLRVARDHPSDPGQAYPAGARARVGAYVKTHPGDELADAIWHALPGD
jgi:iron(II)-dependent oxidoreductase